MRIAELYRPKQFRFIAGSIDDPGPGQVQVRVEAVGICGSDLHYFSEGGIGDTPCVYPMVLGHEPTGTVVRAGAGASGWSAGDRAVLEPAVYCYHCEHCLAGRHNVCARLRFLSTPGDPGFFREFVNLPVSNLLPLPPGMSLAEGTLAEPVAVVLHSMSFAAPRPGERAAVFGAGPIGLATIALLKLSGAGRVWAVDPVAHRLELARALGADAAIDPAAEEPARRILADTGGRGVDIAIDCAARGGSLDQAILAARSAGRVVMTAIPSEMRVSLDFHTARRKELALFNVRRSNHETETAIEMIQDHRALFGRMLTHERPLDRIQEAFEINARYEDGVGKVVIRV